VVEAFHPGSLAEALAIRQRKAAIPFAGGTDLMVKLGRGAGILPGFEAPVLFLDGCVELRDLRLVDGALEIGSMVSLAAIAESPIVHPMLKEIVLSMGGPAIRNAATLGGNICNASPAGDTLPFLYAFEACVKLVSTGGERVLPISEFLTGPGATRLERTEILRSVLVPDWSPRIAFWRKVGTRKANALTKVSIAAFADIEEGRPCRVRISLGAVAPTVVRAAGAERMLEQALEEKRAAARGKAGAGSAIGAGSAAIAQAIGAAALARVRPIDDQRSTAEYRRGVAANLVEEFAGRALAGDETHR
jgi:xanthine dehydrogenase FAD-binding subunit